MSKAVYRSDIIIHMDTYTYELKNSLYLNITNRCNNSCAFCIKYKSRDFNERYSLWLNKEPSAKEVLDRITDPSKYGQVVFCGYGEPLIRLEVVTEIARAMKDKGSYIRIDTDGQANLFHGRNILPYLSGLVDELNISLNAQDAGTYEKICRPVFGKTAYHAVLEFAKLAKDVIPKVVLTAVDLPSVDLEKCKRIADEIGVDFKARPYYETTFKE